jgi:hypothetical protein
VLFQWTVNDKKWNGSRRWCLMPVILATQKAEIGRNTVPSLPGQKSLQDLIWMEKKLGKVIHTCYPSREDKIEGSQSRLAWAKSKTLCLK